MEKKFFSKKTRHRCSVKGCKSLNTTLVSRSRDWAVSVYLCDDCIEQAYDTLKKRKAAEKAAEKKAKAEAEAEKTEEIANND